MANKKGRVEPASAVVARLLGGLGSAQGGLQVPLRIFAEWAEAVGPRIAGHTNPVALSGDVLWIEVDHTAWQNEIYYLGPTLVQQVNQRLGQKCIRQIRVRSARPRPPSPPPPPPPEQISEDDVDFAQTYSSPITDPQVRAAFEAMLAQLTCRRRADDPAP